MARLALEDYFQTMYQDEILKTPVREDYCTYLTPATHLLALRREKAEVEEALVKQKEEFQLKMEGLKERREELENKELDLRRSLEKFNTFLSENEAKKARALKKIDDERDLTQVKDREIERLTSETEELVVFRTDLLKQLQAHKMYQQYMSRVLETAGDFQEISEIMSRYHTLLATHEDLLERLQKNNELLDGERQELAKYTEEKNEEKMTCNMMLAELQTKLDKAESYTVAADYQWSDVSRLLSQKTLVLGRIAMATNNLYYLMLKFGIRDRSDVRASTTFDQLDEIGAFIADMTSILTSEAAAAAAAAAARQSQGRRASLANHRMSRAVFNR